MLALLLTMLAGAMGCNTMHEVKGPRRFIPFDKTGHAVSTPFVTFYDLMADPKQTWMGDWPPIVSGIIKLVGYEAMSVVQTAWLPFDELIAQPIFGKSYYDAEFSTWVSREGANRLPPKEDEKPAN